MAIIYFDGHCNLCNGFVDFLIRHDHRRRLQYAPLQGETARARLSASLITSLNSVVFESEGHTHTESTAALHALIALGGFYRAAGLFLWVPAGLRDWIYQRVAANRYRWWGRRDSCRVPSAAERERFLP